MPMGVDFLPTLAKGLEKLFGDELQNGLILLPTRRAIRGLSDAFILQSQKEGQPSGVRILPPMRPLADIDPDEPPFEPGDLAARVSPAISGLERRFALSRLVRQYYEKISDQNLSPAIALTLTDPLLSILDDVAMEGAGEPNLSGLDDICERAAIHFQTAADFYKIIHNVWPVYLKQIGRLDPMARRVALLDALTEQWTNEPPDYPVIIAGSTGTLPATARLMRCVKNLPKGMIVLPGLSTDMRDNAWKNVKEDHPQYSMKRLLKILDVDFSEVDNFLGAADLRGEMDAAYNMTALRARSSVLSESLVPVDATEEWLTRIEDIRVDFKDADAFDLARENFALIEAEDDGEEALCIAVIMRECLETPHKTATLVTPDPALARRVKSRLKRWGVILDSSAGEPLEETPLGAFLAHCLRLVGDPYNPFYLSSLMASPFAALGRSKGAAARHWQRFEAKTLRGVRKAVDQLSNYEEISNLHQMMKPLLSLEGKYDASVWARALAQAAENLAASEESGQAIDGALNLWRGEAGEVAASLIENIMSYGHALGEFSLTELQEFFGVLMRGQVVRPRFGTHPQLRILGPIEARMLSSDVSILGGLNEGIWPASPSQDPFLSREMRQNLGLTLPERRYGLSAHDFEGLAMGRDVILTRSKRSAGTPMVASRWLWRLKTLFNGAYRHDPAFKGETDIAAQVLSTKTPYLEWARRLDYVPPHAVQTAKAPNPAPPVETRWPLRKGDKISVTKFKTWIRDPYAIYAEKILKLKPLDDLDMQIGPREFGTALHKGMESLLKRKLSDDKKAEARKLVAAFKTALLKEGFIDLDFVKEDIRLTALAEAVIDDFHARQLSGLKNISGEAKGELELPHLAITLTGYPDRIDKGPDGYEIIDFKTGAPPSKDEVAAGFDPQLPLLALMVQAGGFKDVPKGAVNELSYKRLKGTDYITASMTAGKGKSKASPFPVEDHIARTEDTLSQLISQARDESAGYPSQIRRKYKNDYGDYDLLARREEWSQISGDDKND